MRWQGEIKQFESEIKPVLDIESDEEILSSRAILVLSFVSFLGSMVFWSQNITGNVVLKFGVGSVNWVGGVLFVFSMIGFLVYVEKMTK
jgi:hypothetical protein